MDASASALNADDRANELYWGSNMSVNQIADALDLSKGALYELIRPLAAAEACPTCGSETVHTNRTAKEKGLVSCQECGWGGEEGAQAPLPAARTAAPARPTRDVAPRPSRPTLTPGDTAPPPGRPSARLIGGIVLGAAVGYALCLWARRR